MKNYRINSLEYCKKILIKYKILLFVNLVLSVLFTVASIVTCILCVKQYQDIKVYLFSIFVLLGILTSLLTIFLNRKVNSLNDLISIEK